jgi:predicted RecA/RadA family phage recombinase
MKNFVQPGDLIEVTAPYAVVSGAGLLVGSLFGVAVNAAALSAEATIATTGVFTLAKATGAAWTVGQRLYWDDTAKNVTGTASSNKLIGVATAAAGSADTVGNVRLTAAFTL